MWNPKAIAVTILFPTTNPSIYRTEWYLINIKNKKNNPILKEMYGLQGTLKIKTNSCQLHSKKLKIMVAILIKLEAKQEKETSRHPPKLRNLRLQLLGHFANDVHEKWKLARKCYCTGYDEAHFLNFYLRCAMIGIVNLRENIYLYIL